MSSKDQEILTAINYNMQQKVKEIILSDNKINIDHYAKIALLQGKVDLAKIIIISGMRR